MKMLDLWVYRYVLINGASLVYLTKNTTKLVNLLDNTKILELKI